MTRFPTPDAETRAGDAGRRPGALRGRPGVSGRDAAAWHYEATGDLVTVSRLLGHASVATTQRYLMAVTVTWTYVAGYAPDVLRHAVTVVGPVEVEER